MKIISFVASACASLVFVGGAFAQAPAAAPAGSTGSCKDGSFTSNATKKGACAGHKGVKEWFAADAAPAKAAAPATTAPAAPAAAASTTAATPAKTKASTAPADATKVAEGGGPGKVWVNASSKVYHCPGTKYYGTTKQGSYMSEADAKAAGNHADHGKACT